ncbi:MAG: polysaccharide pyruvyl transferase family protein [Rikenellaceae bacterium]
MLKIGIITIHSDLNYGAALQAYALCAYLVEAGYDAKIINYVKIPNSPRIYPFPKNIAYSLMNTPRFYRYRKFLKSSLSNVTYNSLDEIMNGFNESFDVVISGSDQVWNPHCGGFVTKLNPVYYIAFADKDKYKKIAYASSVGSHVFSKEEIPFVQKWLGEYSHLSTREIAGAKQLEGFLNREVKVVLDPTLLLNHKQWLKVSNSVKIKDKYVLVYYIDEIDEVVEYARKIADKNGWKVAMMSNSNAKHSGVDINVPFCGPAEFLGLFNDAEYIATNSFHGTAFAINFQKDFVSVIKRNSPQRAQTLLNNVGLPERLLTDINDVDKLPDHIDYTEPTKKLELLRADSVDYLLNAIEK